MGYLFINLEIVFDDEMLESPLLYDIFFMNNVKKRKESIISTINRTFVNLFNILF
jgi:hypothetical protein